MLPFGVVRRRNSRRLLSSRFCAVARMRMRLAAWRPIEVLPAVGALPNARDEVRHGVQATALALPRLGGDDAGQDRSHLHHYGNPGPRCDAELADVLASGLDDELADPPEGLGGACVELPALAEDPGLGERPGLGRKGGGDREGV